MKKLTIDEIKNNAEIKTYIEMADKSLIALGYSEHSFAHVGLTSRTAKEILTELNYSERTCQLGEIAGFMHDIGNMVNRVDHAQSGAIIAFYLLQKLEMDPEEIAVIVSAIGNHDEGTAVCVSEVAAALILADKSDVRRSRVRNTDQVTFDIHDRVNYAVESSRLYITKDKEKVVLEITIDRKICPVMNYFEIFLQRMMLCRKAAEYLNLQFQLVINGQKML